MQHYDAPGFAQRYADARAMPPHAMRGWIEAIAASVDRSRVSPVLDIGCGTGRFLDALQRGLDADVFGVDRSLPMLKVARSGAAERIRFSRCDVERIPVRDASFGLAFMSMVYHHLKHPEMALLEIRRVLRKDGYLCIRTSTRDLLDRVDYVQFFPSARAYGIARLPFQHDVLECAGRCGFSLAKHQVIDSIFASSPQGYVEKIRQRVNSDLVAVPDEEFQAGLRAIGRAVLSSDRIYPVTEPIDLFIFDARTVRG